jgi:hypothetical protein
MKRWGMRSTWLFSADVETAHKLHYNPTRGEGISQ